MNKRGAAEDLQSDNWRFRLFICGPTPRNMNALHNLKTVCNQLLDSKYKIEVIDIKKNPEMARENNIMACPTVVKLSPEPQSKVIGDCSKTEIVVNKFDLPRTPLPSSSKKKV